MYLRSIIAIAGMLVTSCLSPHQTVVTDTGGGIYRMAFTPAMPVRGVEAIGINQQKSE